MRRLVNAGFLSLLCMAGCSSMKTPADVGAAAPEAPAPIPSPPASQPEPQSAPPPPSPAAAQDQPAEAATAPVPAPSSAAAGSSAAKPKPPAASRPPAPAGANAARPPVAQTRPPSPPAAASAPAASPPAPLPSPPQAPTPPAASQATPPATSPPPLPTLDLKALEQRLRETRAIGVFAKLSLKNQVDDLLSAFRQLYRVPNKRPPAELRQRYDLLLLKVLSLLQDGDPPLATAISSSKEAIWSILADPDKFSKI